MELTKSGVSYKNLSRAALDALERNRKDAAKRVADMERVRRRHRETSIDALHGRFLYPVNRACRRGNIYGGEDAVVIEKKR